MNSSTTTRLITLREVIAIVRMSKSSIYKAIKRGDFPAPVKMPVRSSRWLESEVTGWTTSR